MDRRAAVWCRHRLICLFELHVRHGPRRTRRRRWTQAKAVARCGRCTARAFWRARCCGLAVPALDALRALLWGCRHVYLRADVGEVRQVADSLDWEHVGRKSGEKLTD